MLQLLQRDKRMKRVAHKNRTANSYSLLIATLIALYPYHSCACAFGALSKKKKKKLIELN
jgi:hypothetical protein